MIKSCKILPSLNSVDDLPGFLESDYPVCFLSKVPLCHLGEMLEKLAARGKKGIVHVDLASGISNDEQGAEYLIQTFKPFGLMTTKVPVVTAAKKHKVVAIQQMFLLDSSSVKRSLELIAKSKPDYVYVNPGICTAYYPVLKKELPCPLLVGGLISGRADIERALQAGANSVTVTYSRLAQILKS